MLVLLTTAYTPPVSAVPAFRQHAARDRFRVHQLTDSPEKADLILFVDARADQNDWPMRRIRHHDFVRKFPEKCFVFCEMDQPWCGMPGVYSSMPKSSFDRQRQRCCGYHILAVGEAMAEKTASAPDPELLFSFMGRSLPGAREAVLKLQHPRGLIEDTSKFDFFAYTEDAQRSNQETRYQDVILDSKFVLCPSGAGPASIRQFETLGAGRVPVIISDEWVEVDGPDWGACSVRVAEKDIAQIPEILERREKDWPVMAAAAGTVYRQYFAPDVVFHRLVEACLDIQRHRRWPERVLQKMPSRRYLRLWLRQKKSDFLSRKRASQPVTA